MENLLSFIVGVGITLMVQFFYRKMKEKGKL